MRTLAVAIVIVCAAPPSAWADSNARAASVEMERAQSCLDRKDYGCAVEHFDKARSLSPQSSGPWLGLGLSYAAQDRCGEAVPVLDEYLRRKPTGANPNAIAARSRCQHKLDEEARTPAPVPLVEPPSSTTTTPPALTAPSVTNEPPEPILTQAPPYRPSMAKWKIGLIATGVVLGVGLVVGGITAGVLASRGELHSPTAFTPVVLP